MRVHRVRSPEERSPVPFAHTSKAEPKDVRALSPDVGGWPLQTVRSERPRVDTPPARLTNATPLSPKKATSVASTGAGRPTSWIGPPPLPSTGNSVNPTSRYVISFRPMVLSEGDHADPPDSCPMDERDLSPPAPGKDIGDTFAVSAGDHRKCRDPVRSKRLLMKLHVNYGHASAP